MHKKIATAFILSALIAAPTQAQSKDKTEKMSDGGNAMGMLLFEDDFERSESQEETDEPGNGWATNSKTRAKNDKQVDLKDGAMHISISPQADHGVSVTHDANFEDGTIKLRFMLESDKDSLGLNFADLKYKQVHAGHLCKATISTKTVTLEDLKLGKMNKEFRDARRNKTETDEMKKSIRKKTKRIKNSIPTGQWHDLLVTIAGDTLSVTINGSAVGSFSSEGIAHPTKRMLRVAVPKAVVIDDLKIFKKK